MTPPPIPPDERARLEILAQYDVLDTPPEAVFDDLTEMAAQICQAPIALLTFVDEHRQWFKAALGMDLVETSRAVSFCAHAILEPAMFVVPDATRDARFADNPLVTAEPCIRFFAGAPLMSPEGHALGTLCVIDRESRELQPDHRQALSVLSRHAMALLELRRRNRELASVRAEMAAIQREDSEARFQAFMYDNPAVAWMKDAAGRYVYVNNTLTKVYARAAEEVLGKSDAELLPEPAAVRLRANDEAVLAANQPLEAVEHIPVGDGRLRSWRIWKFPFRDPAGRVHVGGLAFDITERLVAEETVRRSEERYRSLVESANDGILALSHDAIITSLNVAFERITGWRREELMGEPFSTFVHPEDVARAMQAFRRALRGDNPPSLELRVQARHGAPVAVELTMTQQRVGDTVVGVLGIGRDIRERLHLEEQLRQAQKLDSIGRLAAGIAHDFNNLLGVQQAYVALLLNERGFSAEQVEMLREIGNATDRAAALTRQLLLFSRKQVMQMRSLDVNEVVTGIENMLGRLLGEDIALRLECAEQLPHVQADHGMIEQVLMNLAINARDAMPTGGTLVISTETVRLGKTEERENPEARPGVFIRMSVTDDGVGITPAVMDRIFEPFFTTKGVGKGTGLGLATAHGIVKQHGGWMEVSSEPRRGTTVRVFVPVPKLHADEPSAGTVELDAPGGDETVLLVEDEVALRRSTQIVLERHGYRVLTAATGDEALQVWRDHAGEIDLLLTDMVMPGGMTGWQLADRLREERVELKLVFTSGYSPDVAGKELLSAAGSRFLRKPFVPQELVRTLRDCLDD
jgi:two-component system, cell cycle sensor histidine kinase and response regulator CckA